MPLLGAARRAAKRPAGDQGNTALGHCAAPGNKKRPRMPQVAVTPGVPRSTCRRGRRSARAWALWRAHYAELNILHSRCCVRWYF
jgi:hypothetical protein